MIAAGARAKTLNRLAVLLAARAERTISKSAAESSTLQAPVRHALGTPSVIRASLRRMVDARHAAMPSAT
jgi:hypothetical protein